MKVRNQTHWRTDQLRAILQRCLSIEEIEPWRRKRLVVQVAYAKVKGRGSSGRAVLKGVWMSVRLAKQPELLDRVDLAFVICHEMAHLRGMTHQQMRGDARYRRLEKTREIYAWAEMMPLEVKEVQKRPRPTADLKFVRAQEMVRRWGSKVKRATTTLKRWQKREKYYTKKLALAASASQGGDRGSKASSTA